MVELRCVSYMSWDDDIQPQSIITFQYYYGFGAYPTVADQLFTVLASMYDRWTNYFIDWVDSDNRISTPGGTLEAWVGRAQQIYSERIVSVFVPTIHMLMGSAFQKHVLDLCIYYGSSPRDLQWVFSIKKKGVPQLEPETDSESDTFFSASDFTTSE